MSVQLALLDGNGAPTIEMALAARDHAMAKVLEHAEQIHDQWGRVAYLFLVRFSRTHYEFIGHDVVLAFKAEGFAQPHTDKSWGSIFTRAGNVGVITLKCYVKAPHRHGSPCPLYRSQLYSTTGEH